jgi:hypothetical protein
LSSEAFYNYVEKLSQGRLRVPDGRQGAEVDETTAKTLSFDALVKRWDKCINVGGGHVEKKCFFFPGSKITDSLLYNVIVTEHSEEGPCSQHEKKCSYQF